MVKDSAKGQFDTVIVWKLDRFSRDRYDSAFYKHVLKKNGVKVISATENISEGPEGIILEAMLEGMAEYYSAELKVKVERGHKENALKLKHNGGTTPYGFFIDKPTHTLQIQPEQAAIVREMFSRFDRGERIVDIVRDLNDRGIVSCLKPSLPIFVFPDPFPEGLDHVIMPASEASVRTVFNCPSSISPYARPPMAAQAAVPATNPKIIPLGIQFL